jgi:hypothetical protein
MSPVFDTVIGGSGKRVIAVGDRCGNLDLVDVFQMTRYWRVKVRSFDTQIMSLAVRDDGNRLFVMDEATTGNQDVGVFSFRASDGLSMCSIGILMSKTRRSQISYASPGGAETLYVSTYRFDNNWAGLFAINAASDTCSLRWQRLLSGVVSTPSSPSLLNANDANWDLLIGMDSGYVYSLSSADGTQFGSPLFVGGKITTTVAFDSAVWAKAYVVSTNGKAVRIAVCHNCGLSAEWTVDLIPSSNTYCGGQGYSAASLLPGQPGGDDVSGSNGKLYLVLHNGLTGNSRSMCLIAIYRVDGGHQQSVFYDYTWGIDPLDSESTTFRFFVNSMVVKRVVSGVTYYTVVTIWKHTSTSVDVSYYYPPFGNPRFEVPGVSVPGSGVMSLFCDQIQDVHMLFYSRSNGFVKFRIVQSPLGAC